MNCKFKMNAYANILNAGGTNSVKDMEASILSKSDLVSSLKKKNYNLLGPISGELADRDLTDTAKALEDIDLLEEYGLLVPTKGGTVYQNSAKFINSLLTSDIEAALLVNRMQDDLVSYQEVDKFITLEGNKLISDYTAMELNARVNKFLSDGVTTQGPKYFTKVGNTVYISKYLKSDYNNKLYGKYLKNLGIMGKVSVDPDSVSANNKDSYDQFKDVVYELSTVPVKIHAQRISRALSRSRKNYMDNQDTLAINVSRDLQAQIEKFDSVNDRKGAISDVSSVIEYFNDVLELADYFQDNNYEGLTPEIERYLSDGFKFIDLSMDFTTDSGALSQLDLQNLTPGQRNELGAVKAKADYYKARLLAQSKRLAVEEAQKGTPIDLIGSEIDPFLIDQNFEKWWNRIAQSTLSLRHIQNPIIQNLYLMVNRANKLASIQSMRTQTIIGDAYEDKTLEDKAFFQRNDDGITGYLINKMSDKWWKNVNKYITNNAKGLSQRLNYTTEINPYKLFDSKASSTEKKQEEDRLKELLGSEYNRYISVARIKWNNYLQDKANYEAFNPSDSELKAWEERNSPVKRIEYLHNQVIEEGEYVKQVVKGSDKYLLTVPRKQTPTGVNTGLYDPNFDIIENSKPDLQFYDTIRDLLTDVEQNEENAPATLSSPKLAYPPKTFKQKVAENGYLNQVIESTKDRYTSKVGSNKSKLDPVTKEATSTFEFMTTTIGQEMRVRVAIKLANYSETAPMPRKNSKAYNALEKTFTKEAAKEIEEDLEDNFLRSLNISIEDSIKLKHKKQIEIQVKAIQSLVAQDGVFKYRGTLEGDPYNVSKNFLRDSVTYFLNKDYYGKLDDESINAAIEGNNPGDRVINVDTFLKAVKDYTRFTYLAYSASGAIFNMGQGIMSNGLKALTETDTVDPKNLLEGYKAMALRRNRILIENLKVIGDVTYSGREKGEFAKRDKGIFAKRRFAAFYHQQVVESTNQGAMALAILMSHEVTNVKTGEKSNVYSEIDEQGFLDKDWKSDKYPTMRGDNLIAEITVRDIDRINRLSHGDYSSPLLADRTELGKLALLFKKYLPEQLAYRFQGQKIDYITGEYVLGTYRAAAIVAWNKITNKESSPEEVKQAWKGFKEAAAILMMYTFLSVVASSICNEKECKDQAGAKLLMLNMMAKLGNDVILADPEDLWNNVSQPFAVGSAIQQLYNLAASVGQTYQQNGEGYKKGDSKFWPQLRRTIPGYNSSIDRFDRMSKTLQYQSINWFAQDAK